jgi:hypothetical protein
VTTTGSPTSPTLLRALLTAQHLQPYERFRAEYERAAARLEPALVGTAPSRAQFFRWTSGQLKGGQPYPDACRVLEAMFPAYTAADLLSPPADDQPGQPAAGGGLGLLAQVPASFPAAALAGVWVTYYRFSQPAKLHVDLATVHATGPRTVRARNWPPDPRTEGHGVAYRNTIEATLAGRHLVGVWRNTSDARYFGAVQLAVLAGETMMTGTYTGVGRSDVEVSAGSWWWVRLEPATVPEDLAGVRLAAPRAVAELVDGRSPYDPPLPLSAVVEKEPNP